MSARLPVLLLSVLLLFCAVALFSLLTTAMATQQQTAARETIDKVSQVFEAAEPIYEELKQYVAELNEDNDDVADDEDIDLDEAEAEIQQVVDIVAQLDELLSELSSLPADINTSEGKTVLAAREYLTMLKDMSQDLIELLRYALDLYNGILLLDGIDADPASFQDFAQSLRIATFSTLGHLERITPPHYMALSHEDLIKHLRDFNELAADFIRAADNDDPLRINSCINRIGRIARMLDRYTDNLIADSDLQTKQAESRLEGPIALLHRELEQNLNLLKSS